MDASDYVRYRIVTKQNRLLYAEDFGHLVYDNYGDSYFYVFIVSVDEAEYEKLNYADWKARIDYQQTERLNSLTGLLQEDAFYSACEQNLSNVKINWLLFAIDLQNFKGSKCGSKCSGKRKAPLLTSDGLCGNIIERS